MKLKIEDIKKAKESIDKAYKKLIASYKINCTGDVVAGDEITFERAVFKGSIRKPKFDHMERIFAKVLKDSYGKKKQQHTFTLLNIETNETFQIRGRNVYRNGTMRKKWKNESKRISALCEKHERGDIAREERAIRREIEMIESEHEI